MNPHSQTSINIHNQTMQTLKIFGANLRDQSKGQFVVHAEGCADCAKLKGEHSRTETHATALSVSASIWADMIRDGEMTADEGLNEIHFAPCVTIP